MAQAEMKGDTVQLKLDDIETLFLRNNFDILSAKYQISEAEAATIQAKLWDNPVLSLDKELYNKPSKSWFLIPHTGEIAASVQQLILLAGKRNKEINLAKLNSDIARYQFYDLIRTLRYELRTSFFDLYFLERSLLIYDREISALKIITDAFAEEYKKGNVPFKELARLQALRFSLENEKIDVLKEAAEKQSNLILLSGDSLARPVKPVIDISALDEINPSEMSLSHLLEQGRELRYDLRITESQVQSANINLGLQKAMRVPDLNLGLTWDRAAGYVPDYNSITLGFNLPLWNRNQGNIKMSQSRIDEMKALRNRKELEVKNDIIKAFTQLVVTDNLYRASVQKFENDYDKLFNGISTAYRNHTISLLEFIDYYETYKNSKNEYFKLQAARLENIETLNMATGSKELK